MLLKLQKMLINHVGFLMVFFILLYSLFGIGLEDKNVIKGLISGFQLESLSHDSHEKLVEALAVNCRLELIYLKQIYEDLDFNIPSTLSENFANDQASTLENVKKALKILHPQIRDKLFKCLWESDVSPPISGEDVNPQSTYQKHLKAIFHKKDAIVDSRRHLAKASSPPDNPRSSDSKPSSSKNKATPPPDTLLVRFPIPESSESKDKGAKDKGAKLKGQNKSSNDGNSQTTIIATIAATAVVTFFVAIITFCCCRKVLTGDSKIDHRDDRPLLSLSMSDYSANGSSSRNSVDKENIRNQQFVNNSSGQKGPEALDGKLSSGSAGSVAVDAAAPRSSIDASSVLKPPPGRTSVSTPGLRPLKPPPGKAEPLQPEPPASLKPPTSSTAPPPHVTSPSPPPPPAKRSGPPPPGPPPPLGKAGPRAPPPPKGGAAPPRSAAMKAGSSSSETDDNAAKAKLKPFFWDKVMANPDQSMVWHQLKAGSFQFNEDMIESLFGCAAIENNKKDKRKESSSNDPQSQYIQLIDHKKAQNLSILLKALNVTTEEVRDALVEGNELPPELLETLLKMAPTAEEELKLRLFSGEMSQLGPAERFLKVLVDIPFAFRRLEALLFMITLDEEASTIKDCFVTLEAACKELRNSRLFLKLLEAVLKTGNRMNDGTFRGGAQAFKLDTLLKLADVKGTDGKITLLHFVVQEIIRFEGVKAARGARESKSMSSFKSEDLNLEETLDDSEEHYRSLGLQVVSSLGEQLENVRKAACLDGESLTGSITKLGTALIKNKNFLNKEMDEVGGENGFHQALKSFVPHAEGDITFLLEEEKRIMALVKSTADYFHGNSGKEEGLRLFVIVRDFLIILEKVCKEVKEKSKRPSESKKKDPPSRQTSTETPRTSFSSDMRQQIFPATAQRRLDGSGSDED